MHPCNADSQASSPLIISGIIKPDVSTRQIGKTQTQYVTEKKEEVRKSHHLMHSWRSSHHTRHTHVEASAGCVYISGHRRPLCLVSVAVLVAAVLVDVVRHGILAVRGLFLVQLRLSGSDLGGAALVRQLLLVV